MARVDIVTHPRPYGLCEESGLLDGDNVDTKVTPLPQQEAAEVNVISPSMETVICPSDSLEMIPEVPAMNYDMHPEMEMGYDYHQFGNGCHYEVNPMHSVYRPCLPVEQRQYMYPAEELTFEGRRTRRCSAVRKLNKSDEERKEAQRLRNRISAQNHRDRQKRLISYLHDVVDTMRSHTHRLEMELVKAHEAHARTSHELKVLQEITKGIISQLAQLDPEQGERANALLERTGEGVAAVTAIPRLRSDGSNSDLQQQVYNGDQ
eukprot:Platyproteum_vivax@DN810_c0_g1_i1.p1